MKKCTIDHSDQVWTILEETIIALLEEQGREADDITLANQLYADLGIASVDAIHLMIMLEDRLATPLDFEQLAVRDGDYVEDLSVKALFEFLCQSLGLAG